MTLSFFGSSPFPSRFFGTDRRIRNNAVSPLAAYALREKRKEF